MIKNRKGFSVLLTLLLVAILAIGVFAFFANAEEYTATYAVGTDGDNVKAVLHKVAGQSWAAGDSVKITFTTAQGQQTTYTQLSSGEYIGIAWDVPTIFRADGTKLPITIEGPGSTTNLLVGYNNAQAYTVFTNDYTFSTLRFNSFNKGYVLAGSGNIVLNKVGFTGTPTYAADNITARAYAGWTAENFVANAIDGKAQSSITMTNGTVYGNMMSGGVQKLFTSVAFNSSALADQAAADALTFLEADSYPLAPKVAETRAKLVLDYSGTYTISNFFDLKDGYSPCECAFVMKQGTLANPSTAANTLRLRKNVTAGNLDFGDYDVQILGGTLGGMRGAQCNPAHYGNISFTFGEVGKTGPTVNGLCQFSWDGAVINGDANMTINSGTFKERVYGPVNLTDKHGALTINGGTFEAEVYAGGMQTARHTDDIALNTVLNGGTFAKTIYLTPSNDYNANVKNVVINATYTGNSTFPSTGFPQIGKQVNAGYACTMHTTITGGTYDKTYYGALIQSKQSFVGDIINDIQGGTFNGEFYGGASGPLSGKITTTITDGTFAEAVFGGSQAGTHAGDITTTISGGTFAKAFYGSSKTQTSGDVVNNISGGTFSDNYYGLWHNADSVTNNVTGGTFNGSSFYAGQMNGATGAVNITNTITGGTFATGLYFYGGATDTTVGNATTTLESVTIKNYFGGNKNGGTVNNITNIIKDGFVCDQFHGGSKAGEQAGTITNTVVGGEITTFFAGAEANTVANTVCNNVYGGTFVNYYIAGNQDGNADDVVTSNIYGGSFARNFLVGARNVAETISTAPVVNFYTATSAVTEPLATASNPITLNGPIVSDFTKREALNGTNGVAHFFGGDKVVRIASGTSLEIDSLSGNIAFEQTEGWTPGKQYIKAPLALDNQITVTKAESATGAISKKTDASFVIWRSPAGIDPNATAIAENEFKGDTDLVSLTIPVKVETIAAGAFADCPNLEEVVLQSDAVQIDANAFAGSTVKRLIFADNNKMKTVSSALVTPFATSLEKVTVGDSVTTIKEKAFAEATLLSDITLGTGVQVIEKDAFTATAYAQNEENWTDDALYIGGALISVKPTAPATFTVRAGTYCIADAAFDGCTALKTITLDPVGLSLRAKAFDGSAVENLVFSEGVTEVTQAMMTPFTGILKTIVLPASVQAIRQSAFADCARLETITLNSSVNTVEKNAFTGTAFEQNADNWTGDVLYLGDILIAVKPTATGTVSIQSGTRLIADSAMENCTSVTALSISAGLQTIGTDAFAGCSALNTLIIPEDMTGIDASVFASLSINQLEFASGATKVTKAAMDCFADVISTVILPDTVTTIEENAFRGRTALTSVVVPDSVTTIGAGAFYGCTAINDAPIGTGVTAIGNDAFGACTGLSSLTIPASVQSIGANAFAGCTGLATVTMPGDVTAVGAGAFASCPVETLFIADGSTYVATEVTGLFADTLLNMTIADSVTDYAFDAFSGLTSLQTLVIGNGITEIYDYTFTGAPALSEVTLGDGVACVGAFAFADCSNLSAIEFPATLTTLGQNAFKGCSSLTRVDISDLAGWCKVHFASLYANPLYSAHNLYLDDTQVTALSVPAGVDAISDYAFAGLQSATSIHFVKGIESIGRYAFNGCDNVTALSYTGTKVDWQNVQVLEGNDPPINLAIMTFEQMPGDVNGDLTVDSADSMLLDRYLAGWDVAVDLSALDFNQDGAVNGLDAILLDRYLAGWDVSAYLN